MALKLSGPVSAEALERVERLLKQVCEDVGEVIAGEIDQKESSAGGLITVKFEVSNPENPVARGRYEMVWHIRVFAP